MNIDEIISKYMSNSTTEDENIYLLEWLEQKEENRTQFKKAYDLWLYANSLLTDDSDTEIALAHFREHTSSLKKTKTAPPAFHFHLIRIAASILLLLSAGYIGYKLNGDKKQEIITFNNLLTGANGKGEYRLPDGSTVWLNANSVLKYPETFTGGKRMVQLEGEALFDVKKDKNNPFIVGTGGMDIEVVGTRFLVHNYPEKNTVETVLVNGSVQVSGDYFTKQQTLTPGDLLTLNKQTGQIELCKVNTDDYTNWIDSKLVFDRTNLAHVIISLEKWFGVEIIASPELVRQTHMSFTVRRESLETVLTYMTLTAPIEYKWKNNVLYLSSKNKK